MYQVKTHKFGSTYRAQPSVGHVVAMCASSPVAAAKAVARTLERNNRHCLVISGSRPDRFIVEYVDFLLYMGDPIFIHGLKSKQEAAA